MKQSLYTIPDNFFEKTEEKAVSRAKGVQQKRIALMCALPIFLVIAYLSINIPSSVPVQDYSILDNCDIFLEVFEY